MKIRKLIYIYPALSSCGPTNQSFYLISKLILKYNYDIYFFVFSNHKSSKEEEDRFIAAGVKIFYFRFNFFHFINARLLIKKIRPDIIHSTLIVADCVAFLIGFNYKRIITHRTDPFDHIDSRGFCIGYFMLFCSWFVSLYSFKSIACSDAIRSRLLDRRIKCHLTIKNCIPTSFYRGYQRTRILFAENSINIISIGALIKRKNPLKTLEIVKNFSKNSSLPVKLTFIGDGPLKQKIQNIKGSANLRIELVGHVKDIRPYLLKSDLHISSSSAEGLPNSVIESLSFGVPNLLSNIPEHLEFLNIAGKYVNYFSLNDDSKVITKKIKLFLKPNYYINCNDVNLIRSVFSDEFLVDKYHYAYN
jgi:hypothetical protein